MQPGADEAMSDATASQPRHALPDAPRRWKRRVPGWLPVVLGWLLVVLGGFVAMAASAFALAVLFVAALGAAIDYGELWVVLLGFTLGALVAVLGFTVLGVRHWLARALLGLLVAASGFVAFWVVIFAVQVVQRSVS